MRKMTWYLLEEQANCTLMQYSIFTISHSMENFLFCPSWILAFVWYWIKVASSTRNEEQFLLVSSIMGARQVCTNIIKLIPSHLPCSRNRSDWKTCWPIFLLACFRSVRRFVSNLLIQLDICSPLLPDPFLFNQEMRKDGTVDVPKGKKSRSGDEVRSLQFSPHEIDCVWHATQNPDCMLFSRKQKRNGTKMHRRRWVASGQFPGNLFCKTANFTCVPKNIRAMTDSAYRYREVVHVPKKTGLDPRFERLSGKLNEDLFRKTYAFVSEKRKQEIK